MLTFIQDISLWFIYFRCGQLSPLDIPTLQCIWAALNSNVYEDQLYNCNPDHRAVGAVILP